MKSIRICLFSLLLLTACAGGAAQPSTTSVGGPSAAPSSPTQPRTLRMSSRLESSTLARKYAANGGGNDITQRLFNAALVIFDAQVVLHPYLAASLPELNTDTWQVFPDGRMQTTYRLRPGLTWHDGQLLTADDWVFAFKVYTTPGLPFGQAPQDKIESIQAPDPLSVVINWKSTYPSANAMVMGEIDPLPAHILAPAFEAVKDQGGAEAFANHPYWTSDYVGLGPFRLTAWDRGSSLEAEAFAGHALGKPKIDRIIVRVIGDANASLAALLAGDLDFIPKYTLRWDDAVLLERDWVANGKGTVIFSPDQAINHIFQFRPEFQKQTGLLDLRVRKALAYATDRQALIDGIFNGQGELVNSYVPSTVSYAPAVEQAVAKYPYDPRQSEQLMQDVGYRRGGDGIWVDGAGQRFATEFQGRSDALYQRAQQIQIDTWKRAGFEFSSTILPEVQVTAMDRMVFTGIAQQYNSDDEINRMKRFNSAEVGSAANRWAGTNRGGWTSPEYDRLWDQFARTLDRGQRDQLAIQMVKLVSDELPSYTEFFNPAVAAYDSAVHGPQVEPSDLTNHGALWNIHEWEMS